MGTTIKWKGLFFLGISCEHFQLYFILFYFIYLFETGLPYAAQAGLKLVILLPQPPACTTTTCFSSIFLFSFKIRIH
jgi:hypothetical protein